MSGFVAFKSGAFDKPLPGQLPPLAVSRLIHQKYQKPVVAKLKYRAKQFYASEIDLSNIDWSLISSSKTIAVAYPWSHIYSFTDGAPDGNPIGMNPHPAMKNAMMSSSKSVFVFEQPYESSVFQGIFSGVPLMQVDRGELKQGKK